MTNNEAENDTIEGLLRSDTDMDSRDFDLLGHISESRVLFLGADRPISDWDLDDDDDDGGDDDDDDGGGGDDGDDDDDDDCPDSSDYDD